MRDFSRRDFLKLSLLASTYALSGRKAFSQACGANTDVIIIGAGIAGLEAAHYIRGAGLGDVNCIVLEARDRIGGRIWTNHTWINTPVDLGASWVHDFDDPDNPLPAELAGWGATTNATDRESISLHTKRGRLLPKRAREAIQDRFERIEDKVDDRRELLARDISLQSGFDLVARRRRPKLDYAIYDNIEADNAADVRDLSLFHYDCAEIGDEEKVVTNGYDTVVNALETDLDADDPCIVRLDQVVRQIGWDANGVTVRTQDEVYTAKYVIITLPISILQKSMSEGYPVEFLNALPADKLQAVAKFGMGVLNKVYLKFPNVFWDNTDFIDLISDVRGEWSDWLNIQRVYPGAPPVLCALTSAAFGSVIDTWADEAIVAEAMKALRKIYRRVAVPDPQSSLVTHWGRDPFALGSYSHIPPLAVDSNGPDCAALEALYFKLAEPIDGRLFFAGEATHETFPGTVHGAYESGERAAATVLGLF